MIVEPLPSKINEHLSVHEFKFPDNNSACAPITRQKGNFMAVPSLVPSLLVPVTYPTDSSAETAVTTQAVGQFTTADTFIDDAFEAQSAPSTSNPQVEQTVQIFSEIGLAEGLPLQRIIDAKIPDVHLASAHNLTQFLKHVITDKNREEVKELVNYVMGNVGFVSAGYGVIAAGLKAGFTPGQLLTIIKSIELHMFHESALKAYQEFINLAATVAGRITKTSPSKATSVAALIVVFADFFTTHQAELFRSINRALIMDVNYEKIYDTLTDFTATPFNKGIDPFAAQLFSFTAPEIATWEHPRIEKSTSTPDLLTNDMKVAARMLGIAITAKGTPYIVSQNRFKNELARYVAHDHRLLNALCRSVDPYAYRNSLTLNTERWNNLASFLIADSILDPRADALTKVLKIIQLYYSGESCAIKRPEDLVEYGVMANDAKDFFAFIAALPYTP